ncbi:hypothetical protein [Marinobacter nauticus]|uniref:hypothetical protein n=1 Tax=Marinobacter nauticus TaxID=2743 RepID=UPI001C99F58A|nr:hypothetical protein [Marinobacter nauticus]MBY5961933.1 hypothetical protein [Marinobacter nauticus]
MNPHNKDEFAAAWVELDDPAEVRSAFERDDNPEPKPAKYPYKLINGELVKDDGQLKQDQ